jgi:acyl-CoA synthetase (AMP-forming)/AMP-acid ligase II/surfactin synthase thioesterase subunit/acyl carrier protein
MLTNCFKQTPEKIFLSTETGIYTYGELQENIKKIAGLFRLLDINKQDRIILSSTNEAQTSAIFLAAVSEEIGIIIIDTNTKQPRVEAIINKVSPSVIIADQELAESWNLSNITSCKILNIPDNTALNNGLKEDSYYNILQSAESRMPSDIPDKSSLAYIMFTSGTTSDSKGVAISQESLKTHLDTLKKVYSLSADSQLLNQLILSHADGLIQGPVLSAYVGCTWHRPFGFSISRIAELLQYIYKNNISHFIAVPTMLHFIVHHSEGYEDSFKNPAFRYVISVSANLSKSLWDVFENTFKIELGNVYGLTETVAGSLFCIPDGNNYKKYTIGKPIDCSIKIVDDNNHILSAGEPGELCIKGPHIMTGYWKDPIKTNEIIKEGWLYTGDIAIEDEDGFVAITGRKKNVIISGGMNIQPEEVIECVLYNKMIREACAFGAADEILGEKLILAVAPSEGVTLTKKDILDYCNTKLEQKLLPQEIYILNELPKGVSGKVQIEKLKELCLNADLNSTKKTDDGESLLLKIISEIFQIQINPQKLNEVDFFNLGGDSILAALFIAKIEQAYKIKLQFRDIYKNSNLKKLEDLIYSLQDKGPLISEEVQNIKPELYKLSKDYEGNKIVIIANDYYEIHQLADQLTANYDCYLVRYPITFKYADNLKRGINKIPRVEEIADEIIELLNENHIIDEDTIFMGYSFGGLVAFEISSILNKDNPSKYRVILLDAIVSDLRFPFITRYGIKFKRKINTLRSQFSNQLDKVSKSIFMRAGKHFVKSHNNFKKEYMGLAKKIENHYIPRDLEEANAVLITSKNNESKNENIQYWKSKIKNGLTVIKAPGGNHRFFLLEPELSKWVYKLKDILKENSSVVHKQAEQETLA